MNNKLYYQDFKNYHEGDFHINADLEVFFGKEQIGEVKICENQHPEGDDDVVCFLPGGLHFQHYPVSDPGSACQVIYEKYYSQKNRRK
jgi:hypothetical protein